MANVLEKIYKYQLNTEKSRLNLECKSVWEKQQAHSESIPMMSKLVWGN